MCFEIKHNLTTMRNPKVSSDLIGNHFPMGYDETILWSRLLLKTQNKFYFTFSSAHSLKEDEESEKKFEFKKTCSVFEFIFSFLKTSDSTFDWIGKIRKWGTTQGTMQREQ